MLAGLLVIGAIGAPFALAQTASWVAVGPNRTIYQGQAASLYAVSGGGALRTQGMTIALHALTGKGWQAITTRKIDGKGKANFSVGPRATTTYRVALIGNTKLATSYSKPVKITVSSAGLAVVAEAAKQRGKPYRYGAAGPNSFDCSGYTQFVYRRFGKSLPHSATQQSRYGVSIGKPAARPGDLILFGKPGSYYHAAIYAGNGHMWDASTSGQPVALRKIWSQGFVVRRLV
jgi:cell wall-associated NlpC family hydrolase